MAIIVQPTSGMADRLFTLNQFQKFKEKTGIDYVFLFNKEMENCGDFQEYFRIDDGLNVNMRNVNNVQVNDIIKSGKFENWVVSDTLKIYSKNPDIPQEISKKEYLESHNVFIQCSKGIRNLLETHDVFSGTFLDNHIKPSEKIQKILDAYMSESHWSDNVPIGMHIRRTDMKSAIERSPDYLFYSKIDELAKVDPNVRIFLCTDDPSLKKAMLEKYGKEKILTREVRPRYAIGGFEDGVVDMFLLSKCRELYGCIQSGFVELASRVGHIRMTRLMI